MTSPTRLYCFIVVHPFETPQRSFLVLLAPDPFHAVALHNQRRSRATDLHAAAPFCKLERVTAAFYTEARATAFAQDVVKGVRGLTSVCRRFEQLAAAYGVACYSAACPLGEPIVDYVRRAGLSEAYVDAALTFEQAAATLLSAGDG